jgi:redox-sensitive bicupin YhaK (pirin superfamily)
MKTIFHASGSRGHANHGWLNAKHSFSFASWYNPDRIHFGALRVLNDDEVSAGMGFGMHPHDNMEIITIPLEGAIQHKDSMGNTAVIEAGEVQIMSAGTGILHSEFNPKQNEALKLFQIWILPNKRNVVPRYAQFKIDTEKMKNQFLQLVGNEINEMGSWIHQDAWLSMAEISKNNAVQFDFKGKESGVYFMVISGSIKIADQNLEQRDALGVWNTNEVTIIAQEHSKVLAIEVPMEIH